MTKVIMHAAMRCRTGRWVANVTPMSSASRMIEAFAEKREAAIAVYVRMISSRNHVVDEAYSQPSSNAL